MPNPPTPETDILILGGGLAGASAAILLARAGRHVTLVERERQPRHKVCGEFLSTEALTLLQHLGLTLPTHPSPSSRPEPERRSGETPVSPNARAEGTSQPTPRTTPGAPGATELLQTPQAVPIHTVRLASGTHLTEAPLPFPARSFTRRSLDDLLLTAAEQAGAQLLRGTTVEALNTANGLWHAALNTGNTLSAPQALLATGKHDLRGLPRPAGLQTDLVAMKMYWQLTPGQHAALGNAVELLLHPHGYTGLQPVEDGAANLTCLVRREHLARIGGWDGLLADLRRANPHAAQRLNHATPLLDKPLAIASIPYGFVRRHAIAGHLWAVGDQAAVIPSFTGDGMSIALYTGIAAARSILANEPSATFQHTLHRQLRWQVARATALSHVLVYEPSKNLLGAAASLWPGSLQHAASLTRLPKAAISALGLAF